MGHQSTARDHMTNEKDSPHHYGGACMSLVSAPYFFVMVHNLGKSIYGGFVDILKWFSNLFSTLD